MILGKRLNIFVSSGPFHGFFSTFDWDQSAKMWLTCSNNTNKRIYNAWSNLTCYHQPSPPRPLRASPALRVQGWGIVWSVPVPGVGRSGKFKISYLLLDFAKYPSVCVISRAVFTMAVDLKTTYFKGKTQEFVGEWLERNNVSKLKSVFKLFRTARVVCNPYVTTYTFLPGPI